ncbi:GNAT family N-acetyltransferase, partial [Thermoproteota archaeon]
SLLGGKHQIRISLARPHNLEDLDRAWLTYNFGAGNNVAFLVDRRALAQHEGLEGLPSFADLDTSERTSKFIAYPLSEWENPSGWIGDEHTLYQMVAFIAGDGHEPHVVYRRVDEDEIATVVRISPEPDRHVTFDGFDFGGEPIIFRPQHFHFSVLLYILLNDEKSGLGRYNPNQLRFLNREEGFNIAESVRDLQIAGIEELARSQKANLPMEWSIEMIDGKERLVLGGFEFITWTASKAKRIARVREVLVPVRVGWIQSLSRKLRARARAAQAREQRAAARLASASAAPSGEIIAPPVTTESPQTEPAPAPVEIEARAPECDPRQGSSSSPLHRTELERRIDILWDETFGLIERGFNPREALEIFEGRFIWCVLSRPIEKATNGLWERLYDLLRIEHAKMTSPDVFYLTYKWSTVKERYHQRKMRGCLIALAKLVSGRLKLRNLYLEDIPDAKRWAKERTAKYPGRYADQDRSAIARIFEKLIEPQSRILEGGAGYGVLLGLVPQKYRRRWFMLDHDVEALAGADLRRLDCLGRAAGDIKAMPIGDASFDVFVELELLDTLRFETQSMAVAEIRRVLKPDGRAIFLQDWRNFSGLDLIEYIDELMHYIWGRVICVQEWKDPGQSEELRRRFEFATSNNLEGQDLTAAREIVRQWDQEGSEEINLSRIHIVRLSYLLMQEGFRIISIGREGLHGRPGGDLDYLFAEKVSDDASQDDVLERIQAKTEHKAALAIRAALRGMKGGFVDVVLLEKESGLSYSELETNNCIRHIFHENLRRQFIGDDASRLLRLNMFSQAQTRRLTSLFGNRLLSPERTESLIAVLLEDEVRSFGKESMLGINIQFVADLFGEDISRCIRAFHVHSFDRDQCYFLPSLQEDLAELAILEQQGRLEHSLVATLWNLKDNPHAWMVAGNRAAGSEASSPLSEAEADLLLSIEAITVNSYLTAYNSGRVNAWVPGELTIPTEYRFRSILDERKFLVENDVLVFDLGKIEDRKELYDLFWDFVESRFIAWVNYVYSEMCLDTAIKGQDIILRYQRELYESFVQFLGLQRHERVLDLGTGQDGSLAVVCAGYVREVWAIDVSEAVIAHAEIQAQDRGIGNVKFRRANSMRLPFADGFFDRVVSSKSLGDYLDELRLRVLRQVRRVIRPGGVINFRESLRCANVWMDTKWESHLGHIGFENVEAQTTPLSPNLGEMKYCRNDVIYVSAVASSPLDSKANQETMAREIFRDITEVAKEVDSFDIPLTLTIKRSWLCHAKAYPKTNTVLIDSGKLSKTDYEIARLLGHEVAHLVFYNYNPFPYRFCKLSAKLLFVAFTAIYMLISFLDIDTISAIINEITLIVVVLSIFLIADLIIIIREEIRANRKGLEYAKLAGYHREISSSPLTLSASRTAEADSLNGSLSSPVKTRSSSVSLSSLLIMALLGFGCKIAQESQEDVGIGFVEEGIQSRWRDELSHTLAYIEYPVEARQGLYAAFERFFALIQINNLERLVANAKSKEDIEKFMHNLLAGLYGFDYINGQPCLKDGLVLSLDSGNVFTAIDSASLPTEKIENYRDLVGACTVHSQAGYVLLRCLGFNPVTINTPGHVLNAIVISPEDLLLVDFTWCEAQMVDLDWFCMSDDWFILRDQYRIDERQIAQLKQEVTTGKRRWSALTNRERINIMIPKFFVYERDVGTTLSILSNIAGVYSDLGMTQQAVEAHERYLTINPDNLTVYYDLSVMYTKLDRYEDALWAQEQMHMRDPDNFSVCCGIVKTLIDLGRREESMLFAAKAIDINSISGMGLLQWFSQDEQQKIEAMAQDFSEGKEVASPERQGSSPVELSQAEGSVAQLAREMLTARFNAHLEELGIFLPDEGRPSLFSRPTIPELAQIRIDEWKRGNLRNLRYDWLMEVFDYQEFARQADALNRGLIKILSFSPDELVEFSDISNFLELAVLIRIDAIVNHYEAPLSQEGEAAIEAIEDEIEARSRSQEVLLETLRALFSAPEEWFILPDLPEKCDLSVVATSGCTTICDHCQQAALLQIISAPWVWLNYIAEVKRDLRGLIQLRGVLLRDVFNDFLRDYYDYVFVKDGSDVARLFYTIDFITSGFEPGSIGQEALRKILQEQDVRRRPSLTLSITASTWMRRIGVRGYLESILNMIWMLDAKDITYGFYKYFIKRPGDPDWFDAVGRVLKESKGWEDDQSVYICGRLAELDAVEPLEADPQGTVSIRRSQAFLREFAGELFFLSDGRILRKLEPREGDIHHRYEAYQGFGPIGRRHIVCRHCRLGCEGNLDPRVNCPGTRSIFTFYGCSKTGGVAHSGGSSPLNRLATLEVAMVRPVSDGSSSPLTRAIVAARRQSGSGSSSPAENREEQVQRLFANTVKDSPLAGFRLPRSLLRAFSLTLTYDLLTISQLQAYFANEILSAHKERSMHSNKKQFDPGSERLERVLRAQEKLRKLYRRYAHIWKQREPCPVDTQVVFTSGGVFDHFHSRIEISAGYPLADIESIVVHEDMHHDQYFAPEIFTEGVAEYFMCELCPGCRQGYPDALIFLRSLTEIIGEEAVVEAHASSLDCLVSLLGEDFIGYLEILGAIEMVSYVKLWPRMMRYMKFCRSYGMLRMLALRASVDFIHSVGEGMLDIVRTDDPCDFRETAYRLQDYFVERLRRMDGEPLSSSSPLQTPNLPTARWGGQGAMNSSPTEETILNSRGEGLDDVLRRMGVSLSDSADPRKWIFDTESERRLFERWYAQSLLHLQDIFRKLSSGERAVISVHEFAGAKPGTDKYYLLRAFLDNLSRSFSHIGHHVAFPTALAQGAEYSLRWARERGRLSREFLSGHRRGIIRASMYKVALAVLFRKWRKDNGASSPARINSKVILKRLPSVMPVFILSTMVVIIIGFLKSRFIHDSNLPLLTKTLWNLIVDMLIIGPIAFVSGDWIAQKLIFNTFVKMRALKMMIIGVGIFVIVSLWYSFLSWWMPQDTLKATTIKVFLDQSMIAPLIISLTSYFNKLLGKLLKIKETGSKGFKKLMLYNWCFWPIVLTISFGFFSTSDARVSITGIANIIWASILAWLLHEKVAPTEHPTARRGAVDAPRHSSSPAGSGNIKIRRIERFDYVSYGVEVGKLEDCSVDGQLGRMGRMLFSESRSILEAWVAEEARGNIAGLRILTDCPEVDFGIPIISELGAHHHSVTSGSFAVVPDYRNRGIGGSLLRKGYRFLRNRYKRFNLARVEVDNASSLRVILRAVSKFGGQAIYIGSMLYRYGDIRGDLTADLLLLDFLAYESPEVVLPRPLPADVGKVKRILEESRCVLGMIENGDSPHFSRIDVEGNLRTALATGNRHQSSPVDEKTEPKGFKLWLRKFLVFIVPITGAATILLPKEHLLKAGCDPLQVIFYRSLFSFIILGLLYVFIIKPKLKARQDSISFPSAFKETIKEVRRDFKLYFVVGLLQGFALIFTFIAMGMTSAFNVSLFVAIAVVFVLGINLLVIAVRRIIPGADRFLKERLNFKYDPKIPNRYKGIGTITACLGVFIGLGGLIYGFNIGIVALLLLAFNDFLFCWSTIYMEVYKDKLEEGETYDSLATVGFSCAIGCVIYLVFSGAMGFLAPAMGFSFSMTISWISDYFGLFLVVVSSVIFYVLFYQTLKYEESDKVMIFLSSVPIFVALFGLIYGNPLHMYWLIGTPLVFAGIRIFYYQPKAKVRVSKHESFTPTSGGSSSPLKSLKSKSLKVEGSINKNNLK